MKSFACNMDHPQEAIGPVVGDVTVTALKMTNISLIPYMVPEYMYRVFGIYRPKVNKNLTLISFRIYVFLVIFLDHF